ncbi:WGR domain-containing protein [Aminobacter anthyllidis]|uniref:WGR domain-containing protein n=1 Tax=Aminobacter anthyllidis TaxID=1035067 RepID=A0A9X1AGX3_9HYPH|nr:WGR domain-containing protein [Aminobacter anthyllidis]MBT1159533.1 WGR domain-containing protein [Aminobacter anthyllidis]
MIAQHYRLYIERRDADRNMARFYALSIKETLFGQTCLVRRWGRIGTNGRTVQHSFDTEGEAVRLFLELLRAKRMRGYQPRSAYPTRRSDLVWLTGQPLGRAVGLWVKRGIRRRRR